MKFRTEYPSLKLAFPEINHSHKIYLSGSCFSDHIYKRLKNSGFNSEKNAHGILFNPLSIKNSLNEIVSQKKYSIKDLHNYNNRWYSFNHHGSFSSDNPELLIEKINTTISEHHSFLKNSDHLFITFGTAWVYQHIQSGVFVANCHKQPIQNFGKKILKPEDIFNEFKIFLGELKIFNPNLNIYFTISPVKHLKNGLRENSLSKSALVWSVHLLQERFSSVFYFPAFELVNEDLRDYRFYEKDMAHPNELAIDYVWERFSEAYFNTNTKKIAAAAEEYYKFKNHRPINISSIADHIKEVSLLKEKTERIYPEIKLD